VELTGDRGDITMDTGMAITMATIEGMVMVTGPVMRQANAIPPGMFIITVVRE
jgi:hypothetical protein